MKNFFRNILLLSTMLMSMTAGAYDFAVNGIYYNIRGNGAEVTYMNIFASGIYSGDMTIPYSVTYNGRNYTVSSIGDEAFFNCAGLTGISIPYSVTRIGASAFTGCLALTGITIPNSVDTICASAFMGCTGLTSLSIPMFVASIGDGAFAGCSGLTSIEVKSRNSEYDSRDNCNAIIETATGRLITGCKNTVIPNTVTSIAHSAFYGCTGLADVSIPSSVTTIEDQAFLGCTGLTSVTIPGSVTVIGESAFRQCSGLNSLHIPRSVAQIGRMAFGDCGGLKAMDVEEGNPTYDSRQDCNAIIETATNRLVTGCMNTVIPNTVTAVADDAFANCTGLSGVTIPASVAQIGRYAFDGCTGLSSVTCLAATPPAIYGTTFPTTVLLQCTLYVPQGSIQAYQTADHWKAFRQILPLGVTKGDVNTDGKVNITDVSAMIDLLLSGAYTYTETADMDSNGSISISDVTLLIDYLLQQ